MRETKYPSNYLVKNVREAKTIAAVWLSENFLQDKVKFGLPEVDDRYHIWRVPIISPVSKNKLGEVVVDAKTTLIDIGRTTSPQVMNSRAKNDSGPEKGKAIDRDVYVKSSQRNTIAHGDAERVLQDMAAKSVDLVFTSPPYYNARPEYSDYVTYEEYLLKIRKVIQSCHRVLNEGRFFVMNIAPVLIRRASRSEASKRIAAPFDVHRIFEEEGFDFVDDIIWVKPSGAGWATGRGRRFAADRNPLQYKAVPVTEYVLVYRKKTDKLIDWNIRTYPDQASVRRSKISDNYEQTNIWKISPAHSKKHPAIFPDALVERVVRYYSFIGDVVMDPFAGLGTVGRVAARLERGFVLIEQNESYFKHMKVESKMWSTDAKGKILFIDKSSQTMDELTD